VAVGAPSFLAGLGATLLLVLVNNLLVAVAGAVALSTFALCSRIGTFVQMPQLGIAQGLQPLAGYNAGRGLWPRVRRAMDLAFTASVGYGLLVAVALLVLAGPLVGAFTDDPAVQLAARGALRILVLGYPLAGITLLVSAYFQALGRPRPSYLISIGTLVVIKIPVLLVLGRYGPTGVWVGLAVGELLAATVALVIWRRLGSAG
jgi:Na+-driven multidrug efflux pump